ncbi:MAG: hypothetical protein MUO40_06515, partial [Anaerolineaceae bacterium]|nr:hypothetical protein [Anaerolineaceae bacterium]
MNIYQVNPRNRTQLRRFIKLQELIYANNPLWVPPLAFEARRVFNTRRHGFYQHGVAIFFIAEKDSTPIGRLAVLNNHTYN